MPSRLDDRSRSRGGGDDQVIIGGKELELDTDDALDSRDDQAEAELDGVTEPTANARLAALGGVVEPVVAQVTTQD